MTDDDPSRVAIWRLQQTLGRALPTAVAESEPVLVVAGVPDEGTHTVTVRCGTRRSDGDRLWFWLDRGPGKASQPLAEVDRLADAALLICGEHRAQERDDAPVTLLKAKPEVLDLGSAELT